MQPAGTIASVDAQPDISKKAPAPISPIPKSDNKNPDGYTVLEKAKTYITEGGYTTPSSGATYRYFNGKWENKNGTSWIPTKTSDKNYHLGTCFSKNAPPTPPVVPEKAPPPPVTKAIGVTTTTCDCKTAKAIKNAADTWIIKSSTTRKSMKQELKMKINRFRVGSCATECATDITAALDAISKIP